MRAIVRFTGPERPWLLLVHGMLTNARHWQPNLAALAPRFNLVRIDLPGHGTSPPPADPGALTLAALLDGIEALRAHLEIPRWFVCGQSFGAGLTLHYARRHPDRVIAQAFTNARVILRAADNPEEAAARARRLDLLARDGVEALRREVFHPRHARRFPPGLRAALSEDADRIDLATYFRLIAHVGPEISLRHLPDSAPAVPTLLINGRHERAFQPDRAALAALWPNLVVADLDGGHSVNIENPDRFSAALTGFFARAAAPVTRHIL
ncbi:alpha/beta fold hydrolase [Neotabrizicola sp. VNH66]|uniref:alpha/beta fold hydrolase n=1 Tax=Neotabrizicola sp. VNH66 TaxID=3400918 RepID=UPI003C0222FD